MSQGWNITLNISAWFHHVFTVFPNEKFCDITFHGLCGNEPTISILMIKIITAHNTLWIYTNGNRYEITLTEELFLSIWTAHLLLYLIDDKWFGTILFVVLLLWVLLMLISKWITLQWKIRPQLQSRFITRRDSACVINCKSSYTRYFNLTFRTKMSAKQIDCAITVTS